MKRPERIQTICWLRDQSPHLLRDTPIQTILPAVAPLFLFLLEVTSTHLRLVVEVEEDSGVVDEAEVLAAAAAAAAVVVEDSVVALEEVVGDLVVA